MAFTIAIGELGDKTFLASLGLGIEYPLFKISLICGSICGMVVSDSIAIFFGKFLSSKISNSTIELLSNIIFIIFGIIGLFSLDHMEKIGSVLKFANLRTDPNFPYSIPKYSLYVTSLSITLSALISIILFATV